MNKCPKCKKVYSNQAGLKKNKSEFVQRYYCNPSNNYFVDRKGFERMRTKPEILVDAIDLRAKRLSFGKIKDPISQNTIKKVSQSTILDW